MTNFNNLAPVKETTIKGDDFLIFDSLEFRNQSANNEQITKWTTKRGGDRKSIDYILTIAVHLYAQPLNNRPVKRYGIIFRHVREDFIDITTRARIRRKTHYMGLNLKSWFCMSIKRESRILITWFCQSIKRKPRKQIPPKSGIKRMHYFLFCLLSFSRQAAITQAEKLVFSFWDCSSIFSISSCGKRIPLVKDLLFLYPVAISKKILINLVFKHYTLKNCLEKALTCLCTLFYSVYAPSKFCGVKKQSPEVLPTLSRDLTKPLNEVMIMANRYDSAPLRAEQSKLFKFYDLSTAQVIQTTATTERQARKNLGKQSLIFIARIRITPIIERARTWGGYNHE